MKKLVEFEYNGNKAMVEGYIVLSDSDNEVVMITFQKDNPFGISEDKVVFIKEDKTNDIK